MQSKIALAKGTNTLDVFSERQSAKRLFTRQMWLFYALRSVFFLERVARAVMTIPKNTIARHKRATFAE